MKYFNYLSKEHRDHLFYKDPIVINKDLNNNLLKYSIGALLYVPAICKDMLYKCAKGSIVGLVNFVICLEDAIGKSAEAEAINNIYEVLDYIKSIEGELPLIFIRPKDIDQLEKISELLVKYSELLAGIVIPKANGEKIEAFKRVLNNNKCEHLYIMPIIETVDFIESNSKNKSLVDLYTTLRENRERVLNIRVGVTDILGYYGIRRDRELNIYDNKIISNFFSDILTLGNKEELNIPISAGVSEFYNFKKEVILNNYIKEIKIDRLNGFVGKTVIHPMQMKIVQAMSVITYEDYIDAKKIINDIDSKYSISSSLYGDRMNEVNPHLKWAKKIMKLSEIYGVLKEGKEFNELYKISLSY